MRQIGTLQGEEGLYAQHSPEMLESLRQVPVIQSTESSNRIEGGVRSYGRCNFDNQP